MNKTVTVSELIKQLSLLPENAKIEVSASNSYDHKEFCISAKIKCFTWNIKHAKILGIKIAKY